MDPIDEGFNSDVRYPPVVSDDNAVVSPESSPLNAPGESTVQDPLPRTSSSRHEMTDEDYSKDGHRQRRHHRRSPSTLLAISNERLAHQAALSRSLQTQSDDIFSALKATYQKNLDLQTNLTKAQCELALYKHQLQLAENEIKRAEEIVKDVDHLRVAAEERSVRDREKLRKLLDERAVWIAREEGQKEGYLQGLEQGRKVVWGVYGNPSDRSRAKTGDADSLSSRTRTSQSTSPRPRRHRTVRRPPPNEPQFPALERSASGRNARSSPEQEPVSPPLRAASSSSNHRRRQNKTPAPVDPNHPRSRKTPNPENIRPLPVPSGNEPIRPIPVHNVPPSPSLSHRDVIVPPDNFIPTKTPEAGGYIHLPPPHEFSHPVDPEEPRREVRTPTHPPAHMIHQRTRTMSSGSGASTRISEYDLVSPPRGAETRDPRFTGPAGTPTRQHRTPAARKVEEWRRNSAEVLSPAPRRMFKVMNASAGDNIGGDDEEPAGQGQPPRPPPRPSTAGPIQATRRLESPSRHLGGPRPPRTPVNPLPPPPHVQSRPRAQTPGSPPIVQIQEGPPSVSRKTPLAWLRSRFQRSHSSPAGVANNNNHHINIQVEPPSASASSTNTGTVVDPILLTPEHANRVFSPTSSTGFSLISEVNKSSRSSGDGPISIVLPDDRLPPGFVPQSPMMPITMPTNIIAMNATIPAGPSLTAAFNSPARPATALAPASPGTLLFNPPPTPPRPSFAFPFSPAPLERPISLFDED